MEAAMSDANPSRTTQSVPAVEMEIISQLLELAINAQRLKLQNFQLER
jgi:hypothetical protein